MKAFVITVLTDYNSLSYSKLCIESSQHLKGKIDLETFSAVTSDSIFEISWSWPQRKKAVCEKTKLTLTAYKNADIRKRIACAQSHYLLWKKCIELDETILILEHDAIFTKRFEPFDFDGGICSINSPINATFNADLYDHLLIEGVNEVPWVADRTIPQGLPGNSAYMIKPWAARELIDLQDTIGWWPNDAIMCRQLCPWLRCYKPYFTQVQGIKSTTSH